MAICLLISLGLFLTSLAYVLRPAGRKSSPRRVSRISYLMAGTYLAALVLFLPIYSEYFRNSTLPWLKTALISAHNALRLFVVDGEFDIIQNFTRDREGAVGGLFAVYASVLYMVAPVLTFSFLLSFFRSVSARLEMAIRYFADIYVFSELNNRSVALAATIRENHPKAIILFADVFDQGDEQTFELLARARAIRAITTKDDVKLFRFSVHSKKSGLCFFIMGQEERENNDQAIYILQQFRERENTRLYLFSDSTESEMLIASADPGRIRVQRVNVVRSLIYRELYEQGRLFFDQAVPDASGERHITALIVGMGRHGTEMMRALSWFCQMPGYTVTVHAFDRDKNARSRFAAQCPELMAERLNGKRIEGESFCDIRIHSGVEPGTEEFRAAVTAIPNVTYALVSLGQDTQNVEAAALLRSLLESTRQHPRIEAVVRSTGSRRVLANAQNFKGQRFDIDWIGDEVSVYDEDAIVHSALEEEALERHRGYGASEESFWRFEYNYRSSMAAAIHRRLRIELGVPGADKSSGELTTEERDALELLEHKRWNAYMRSEGYSYSGSRDKSSRNDLARLHNDLVPFMDLTESDKRKDSSVGTKK